MRIPRCVGIFSLLSFVSCNRAPTVSHAIEPLSSRYVRRTNAERVIVFVHGIFGDARSTWVNEHTGAYWPDLVANDDQFDHADVYAYSFSSPFVSGSYTIDELVENMRLTLDGDRVFQDHKQVLFICHSMGGLVTRGYLRRYHNAAAQVPLIFFFSTPTSGADIARLGQLLSRNPQLGGMLPRGASEYLMILQRDWRAANFRITSRCAYETADTYGIRVVPEASASALCSTAVDPMDRDHLNIVKARDRRDLPYVAFLQAYKAIPAWTETAAFRRWSTGATVDIKEFEVACAQTLDTKIDISLPRRLKDGEHVVDAIVSIQDGRDLKEHRADLLDRSDSGATVRLYAVGLDRARNGACSKTGKGVLVVAFVTASTATPSSQRDKIVQSTRGDMSPTIYGVTGNVTIIVDAAAGDEPVRAKTSSMASHPPLAFATNPALHGLLLQSTEGNLSPAVANVGGSVTVKQLKNPAK